MLTAAGECPPGDAKNAALGALGQFCLITPSRQTVVVRLGSALVGDAIGLDITFKIWQFLNQNLFNN